MKRPNRRCFVLAIVALALLSINGVQAQQSTPTVTARLIWEIDREICPAGDDPCYPTWRFTPDREYLFGFTADQRLHRFGPGDTFTEYDLEVPPYAIRDLWAHDENRIITMEGGELVIHDLQTGSAEVIFAGQYFDVCDWRNWGTSFYSIQIGGNDWLLTCRDGVVLINPMTEEMQNIAEFEGGEYPEWYMVSAGHDNAVYIEPWATPPLLRRFVSLDYREAAEKTWPFLRYDLDSNRWSLIEIRDENLMAGRGGFVQLIGVDADSNMYFYLSRVKPGGWDSVQEYYKVDSRGEVVWVLNDNDFSVAELYPVDVTAEGHLIMRGLNLVSDRPHNSMGTRFYEVTID